MNKGQEIGYFPKGTAHEIQVKLGLPVTVTIVYAVLFIIPVSLFFIALGLLCGSVFGVKQVGGICGSRALSLSLATSVDANSAMKESPNTVMPGVSLCIGIMKGGKLLALGTAEELKNKAGTDKFEDAFIAIVKGERP